MAETDGGGSEPNWERGVLEKVALAAIAEQRAARRWSIAFKLLLLGYLFIVLFVGMGWIRQGEHVASGKHTALVELRGVIAADTPASADNVTSGLQAAFKDANTQGVILRINSPGGSPVQAGYINDEIKRLRKQKPEIPLYVVVEDICASGGYYVAAAADQIYVDKASIVGSIGVVIDGFGFTSIMDKLGIERRAITAGENKRFLDPFAPLTPAHREYAEKMIGEIHQQFINMVKEGRGKRLKDAPDLFSGLIWTGERSIELGLADALGNVESVARDVIKAEEIVDFTPRQNLAERVARKFGAAMAEALVRASAGSAQLR